MTFEMAIGQPTLQFMQCITIFCAKLSVIKLYNTFVIYNISQYTYFTLFKII